jgi:hypothetical protein
MTMQRGAPENRGLAALGLFLAALAANVWFLFHGEFSLRGVYEFRQVQTAITAYYFKHEGLKLAYDTPVLGPPWSIPMEFPTYQAVVAVVSNATGLDLETAGRLTSMFFFYAAIPAVLLLLRRWVPSRRERLVVASSILICPPFLLYSRTFLIESTALCLALWFLVAFVAVLERPTVMTVGMCWFLGALACATKITTFAVVCVPAGLIVAAYLRAQGDTGGDRRDDRLRTVARAALGLGVPLLAGTAWIGYSDALKLRNPYGQLLTSEALRTWNLGTMAQRVSAEFWRKVGKVTLQDVLSVPAIVIAVVACWRIDRAYRRLALFALLCYPGGFVLFANLYYVHDYYFYSSALFAAVALGVIAAGLLRAAWPSRPLAVAFVLVAFGGQIWAFSAGYKKFGDQPASPPPTMAELVRRVTPPNDVVAILGMDWNGVIPYYAERRAIMMFNTHIADDARFHQSLAGLGPRKVAAMVVGFPYTRESALVEKRARELDLVPDPIARVDEAQLYVRDDLLAEAKDALRSDHLTGVQLNLDVERRPPMDGEPQDLAHSPVSERLAMTSPRPYEARGPHPISVLKNNDTDVIAAHSPTEIFFHPPENARHVHAVAGMMSGSYQGENRTDGVTFEVVEQLPDGSRRILFRRLVQPLTVPADRAELTIDFDAPAPFVGSLVFATYPGPREDNSYDWAYWRRIEIR